MDQVIDLNVRGVFIATQAALKQMNDGGRIIMIGSSVGERMMAPGLVPYSATKGAIRMFTQGLSREVGDRGITVNNIQPGPIDTDLNPAAGEWAVPQKAVTALNRYGSVDEVAASFATKSALFGHGAMSALSPLCAQERTSTDACPSQDLRAKRDSKSMYLTAWIASFVRVPCR